jgi:hypothetical protein
MGGIAMASSREDGYDLFVSYAHEDDRDGWIRELIDVIQEIQRRFAPARPWRVFFDTHAICTMDDWEKSIGDGLRSAGAMLVLMSPAYFRSDWCCREWEEFCRQEQARGEPRNRIAVLYLQTDLRFQDQTDDDDWRQDLRRRQHMDLRDWRSQGRAALREWPDYQEQLRQLLWIIHERLVELSAFASRRLGVPCQWPPLPAHYVRRPREEERLQADLLGEDAGPGVVVSAVFGLGGIGKSTLASAVVQTRAVQERFPDGVLWATLGQNPELQALLGQWIRDLGDHEFRAVDARSASGRLRQLLQERAVLLVVDDAWSSAHAEPFRVGGPRCRTLVTTRRAGIADEMGAVPYELDVLDPEQAVELLSARLQRRLEEGEFEPAHRLAEAVGRLPLALELASVRLSRGTSWEELLHALEQEVASLEALEDPAKRRQGKARLQASFNLSLRALRSEDEGAFHAFVWLGVLPDDTPLTAPMAATLWDLARPAEADELLEYLWSEGLLQASLAVRVGERSWRAYRVHDLLHDCARRLLTGPVQPRRAEDLPGLGLTWPEAHRELLRRYQCRARDGQWHRLPPDGYIHGRLGWHLESAGDAAGLHALLREETPEGRNGWFEATERLGQPATFADDVARAWRLADEAFLAGREGGLALVCRYALLTASLNSLAENLPAKLLEAVVQEGLWSVERALAYARRKPKPVARLHAVARLVPLLKPEERSQVFAEVLEGIRNIGSEDFAAGALEGDQTSGYDPPRVNPLAELAEHLPAELLPEAVRVARHIGSEWDRSRALGALAGHLPAEQRTLVLAEALQTARQIRNDVHRVHTLAALAPLLPGEQRRQVVTEALQAARQIGLLASTRARVLAALAEHLPAEERRPVVAEALQTARESWPSVYAAVVAALAPLLPVEQRRQVVVEALQATRSFGVSVGSARALAALAPHLAAVQLRSAIAEKLQEAGSFLPEAVAALAEHLPTEQRRLLVPEALQTALQIRDHSASKRALDSILQSGKELAHSPGLTVVGSPSAVELAVRWRALAELAAQAVAPPEGIRHIRRVLAALAAHLPLQERCQVLAEALQGALQILDVEDRSDTLETLAPLLTGLPGPVLSRLWTETLPVLAARRREGLFRDLCSLSPAIAALAKVATDVSNAIEDVCAAINDVARLWP